MFSNREISLLLWVFLFLLFVFSKKTYRQPALGVIRAAASMKLVSPIIVELVLISIATVLLFKFELWNFSLLKETIAWIILAGIFLVYRGVGKSNPNKIIWESIKDHFKILVLFEFLINAYNFPLVAEILLLPCLTILAMLIAVAETDQKYRPAQHFFKGIEASVGLTIIGFVIWSFFQSHEDVFNMKSGKSLLLPIYYMIWTLPLTFLLAVYAAYENLFIPFAIHKNIDWKIKFYAKMKLIFLCGLNPSKTVLVKNQLGGRLAWAKSTLDVREEIESLKESLKNEIHTE